MRLSIDSFKGIRPMLSADLLAGNEAQIADNAKITSGQLEAWYNELQVKVLESSGTVRTIYLYDDQYWLEWEAAVNIVPAPISGDTQGKLYYTGDGIPKKTNKTEATTGAGAMPINFFPLAVPTATLTPTATLGGGGSGDARAINYTWTVVTDWSEEGLNSPASNTVSAMQGQTVDLTGMTLVWQSGTAYNQGDFVFPVGDEDGTYLYKCVVAGTSGAAEPGAWGTTVDGDTTDGSVTWRCFKNNLKEKRVYRINTGESYAQYQLVDTIGVSTTTYADSKTDTDLAGAAVLPSESWDYPPDQLSGLTYMSNGILAGFVGKDLYFSEAYRPWAWPTGYSLSLSSPIVSIISLGSTLIVTTEKEPYSVTGIDPNNMVPLKMPEPLANVSARSSVGYTSGGIYAAPNGLYLVDGAKGMLLTKDHYTVDEWSALHPETMHSYIHDHKVFIFYSSGGDEGGLVFDLITGQITALDFYVECAYVDPKTDILYFRKLPNNVYQWEGDQTQPYPSNWVWRSKKFLLPYLTTIGAARIIAELSDREDHYVLLAARRAVILRNSARISSGFTGGTISEELIGELAVNSDELETPPTVGDYSGDFNLVFRLYVDGTLKFTKEVYTTKPFRCADGFRGRTFEFEIEGNVTIRKLDWGASISDLKQIQ